MNALKDRNTNQKKRRLDSQKEADVLSLFGEEAETTKTIPTPKKNSIDINKVLPKLKKPLIILLIVIFAIVLIYLISFLFRQPIIKLNGEEEIEIEVMTDYKDDGVKATYFGSDISSSITTTSTVNTTAPGTYKVEYTVTKGSKTKTTTRKVVVIDTTPPDLSLIGETQFTISALHLFKESGYKAVDNLDGDITSKVKVEKTDNKDGSYTIKYIITDNAGNKSEKSRIVHINDTVPPQIAVNGKKTVWVPHGAIYTEHGAWAIDDADGVLTDNVMTAGEVNTKVVGDYIVTYSISDSSGNIATTKRTVKVAPMKQIPENELNAYDGVSRIYLTFDDGPSSNITPRILDILKENNVKATFFILNYSNENKAIIKRAIDEGHTIGIHGYTHDWNTYSSDEAYLNNIQKLHDKLYNDFGYDTKIIRFLGGSSNTLSKKYSIGVMSRLAVKVKEAGYEYFDWNVSTGDSDASNVPIETQFANYKKFLKVNKSNIVLMHDNSTKKTTADALPHLIKYGKENGYKFEAITIDTYPVHHNIYN